MVKPLSDAFFLLLVEKTMWVKDVQHISTTLVHRKSLGCCVLTKCQCHEGEKMGKLDLFALVSLSAQVPWV